MKTKLKYSQNLNAFKMSDLKIRKRSVVRFVYSVALNPKELTNPREAKDREKPGEIAILKTLSNQNLIG